MFNGSDGGAVDVYEIPACAYLSPLLELCLADVAVESDKLVFGID